ncbi:hypothetical protein BFW87_17365 [Pseudomonas fluorescens]|uniref:DNA mismatch repair protein MutS-like N-terminal domain-containing protein n=1 Tax=Pseudomonas fluorescens TaxID=294 RepID=A0A1T2YJR7_PSEFL|nr:hypothetical protein BFW87_17365 [Pseudomonas fluorescens]
MQQYWRPENQRPDQLMFYRTGDFYETFYEDAKKALDAIDTKSSLQFCGNGYASPLSVTDPLSALSQGRTYTGPI